MIRIIESIPSKNAETIKQWLAKLGSERIDEIFDPSIAIQRAVDTYRENYYLFLIFSLFRHKLTKNIISIFYIKYVKK